MCGGMFSGKAQRLQMIADAQKEADDKAAAQAASALAAETAASANSTAQAAGGQAAPGVVVKGTAGKSYDGAGTKNVRVTSSDQFGGYSDVNQRRKKKSALAGLGL